MKIKLKNFDCTGCGCCSTVCPTNAITMKKSNKGFYIANIDHDKCIKCHLCEKACFSDNTRNEPISSYIIRHKNYTVFSNSQSGGAFTLISDFVLDNGGQVFCACLVDGCFKHIKITSKNERDCCRGSLYIQSELGGVFSALIDSLKKDLYVLFVGTPCQVNAIKSIVKLKNINVKKLITIDLLCHGVTSSLVLDKYIRHFEKKYGSVFRSASLAGVDKETRPYFNFLFKNGKIVSDFYFKKIYYSNLALNNCCYRCNYTSIKRIGDFSIGDAQQVLQKNPEFYNPKGTSLLLINTEKANNLFDLVKYNSEHVRVSIEAYTQDSLRVPPSPKRSIDEFWFDFFNKNFSYVLLKYAKHNVFLNIRYILCILSQKVRNI